MTLFDNKAKMVMSDEERKLAYESSESLRSIFISSMFSIIDFIESDEFPKMWSNWYDNWGTNPVNFKRLLKTKLRKEMFPIVNQSKELEILIECITSNIAFQFEFMRCHLHEIRNSIDSIKRMGRDIVSKTFVTYLTEDVYFKLLSIYSKYWTDAWKLEKLEMQ